MAADKQGHGLPPKVLIWGMSYVCNVFVSLGPTARRQFQGEIGCGGTCDFVLKADFVDVGSIGKSAPTP